MCLLATIVTGDYGSQVQEVTLYVDWEVIFSAYGLYSYEEYWASACVTPTDQIEVAFVDTYGVGWHGGSLTLWLNDDTSNAFQTFPAGDGDRVWFTLDTFADLITIWPCDELAQFPGL